MSYSGKNIYKFVLQKKFEETRTNCTWFLNKYRPYSIMKQLLEGIIIIAYYHNAIKIFVL